MIIAVDPLSRSLPGTILKSIKAEMMIKVDLERKRQMKPVAVVGYFQFFTCTHKQCPGHSL